MKNFVQKLFFSLSIFTFSFFAVPVLVHTQTEPDPQPQVTVTFPGWLEAEYREAQTPGQYYPYVKSNGSISRNPIAADIYLVLNNASKGTVIPVALYPGGSQSFNITWPSGVNVMTGLIPGDSYEIYLSDTDGSGGEIPMAVAYQGLSTFVNLGTLPGTGGGGTLEQGNQPDPGEDTGTGGGNGSGGGTNTNPMQPIEYNATQQDILDSGVVPTNCGYNLGRGEGGRMCGFTDLIVLIQRVIEYIFILVLPIMAIVIAYAGYLYLTSGGNSGKRTKAKEAITKSLIGIVVIMSAWLIVKTIVTSLGVDSGIVNLYLG